MARVATRPTLAFTPLPSLLDIGEYQRDTEASLYYYFAPTNPAFATIFAGDLQSEVQTKLALRVDETDTRSALAVMSRIEAAFQIDYKRRCDAKKPDLVSVEFRRISRIRGKKARLDEDIWETWRNCHATTGPAISQLRSVFKFRHWLAHGRYWQHGTKYDFQTLYGLATVVFSTFPLYP